MVTRRVKTCVSIVTDTNYQSRLNEKTKRVPLDIIIIMPQHSSRGIYLAPDGIQAKCLHVESTDLRQYRLIQSNTFLFEKVRLSALCRSFPGRFVSILSGGWGGGLCQTKKLGNLISPIPIFVRRQIRRWSYPYTHVLKYCITIQLETVQSNPIIILSHQDCNIISHAL